MVREVEIQPCEPGRRTKAQLELSTGSVRPQDKWLPRVLWLPVFPYSPVRESSWLSSTYYAAKDDLELPILLNASIRGSCYVPPLPVYAMLGLEPGLQAWKT